MVARTAGDDADRLVRHDLQRSDAIRAVSLGAQLGGNGRPDDRCAAGLHMKLSRGVIDRQFVENARYPQKERRFRAPGEFTGLPAAIFGLFSEHHGTTPLALARAKIPARKNPIALFHVVPESVR